MKQKLLVGAAILVASLIGMASGFQANAAGVLTIDITGVGTGTLNGIAFSSQPFDIHLVGNENNTPLIDPLSIANITINGFAAAAFSDPTRVGLNFAPDFAFFGLSNGPTDLMHLTFSPTDFAALQGNSFGPLAATFAFFGITNVQTGGGLLSFTDIAEAGQLTGNSTGDVVTGVPELSTWVMMLIGFASIGFMTHRRQQKVALAVA
jgi:hypothetical protein